MAAARIINMYGSGSDLGPDAARLNAVAGAMACHADFVGNRTDYPFEARQKLTKAGFLLADSRAAFEEARQLIRVGSHMAWANAFHWMHRPHTQTDLDRQLEHLDRSRAEVLVANQIKLLNEAEKDGRIQTWTFGDDLFVVCESDQGGMNYRSGLWLVSRPDTSGALLEEDVSQALVSAVAIPDIARAFQPKSPPVGGGQKQSFTQRLTGYRGTYSASGTRGYYGRDEEVVTHEARIFAPPLTKDFGFAAHEVPQLFVSSQVIGRAL